MPPAFVHPFRFGHAVPAVQGHVHIAHIHARRAYTLHYVRICAACHGCGKRPFVPGVYAAFRAFHGGQVQAGAGRDAAVCGGGHIQRHQQLAGLAVPVYAVYIDAVRTDTGRAKYLARRQSLRKRAGRRALHIRTVGNGMHICAARRAVQSPVQHRRHDLAPGYAIRTGGLAQYPGALYGGQRAFNVLNRIAHAGAAAVAVIIAVAHGAPGQIPFRPRQFGANAIGAKILPQFQGLAQRAQLRALHIGASAGGVKMHALVCGIVIKRIQKVFRQVFVQDGVCGRQACHAFCEGQRKFGRFGRNLDWRFAARRFRGRRRGNRAGRGFGRLSRRQRCEQRHRCGFRRFRGRQRRGLFRRFHKQSRGQRRGTGALRGAWPLHCLIVFPVWSAKVIAVYRQRKHAHRHGQHRRHGHSLPQARTQHLPPPATANAGADGFFYRFRRSGKRPV